MMASTPPANDLPTWVAAYVPYPALLLLDDTVTGDISSKSKFAANRFADSDQQFGTVEKYPKRRQRDGRTWWHSIHANWI